ncbi:MAG: glycosyltransferase family 2 protein, partial [Marinirhabdus sp.]
IGALGVRYLDGTGNFLPEGKRNLPTPKVSFLKLLGMGKSYYVQNIGEGGSGKVPVLAGAFMFMKKETYQQVQGFDETYFMYGEDIDLSYKLLKAGYENHYTGAAQILHYKGESTQKDTVYLERFYKAMHVFYTKHFNYGSVPNAAVALGLWLAKIIKRLGFATVAKKMPPRQQALLFSKNPALIKKLTPIIDVPLRAALQTALQQGSIRNTLFVFDAEHMGYGAIFQAMQRYKNMGNSFRVRPKGCNFILGSDHSGTMGEVLHF